MTATLTELPDLRVLSLDDLERAFASAADGSDLWRACLRECQRRDRMDRARHTRATRDDQWETAAYAQFLSAERECCGNLTSRAGNVAVANPWPRLWIGPESLARKLASEELNEYWDKHGRLSVSQYRRQLRESARIARDEADLAAMDAAERRTVTWDWSADGSRIRRTTVTVNGEARTAWWRITPDGKATLHATLEDAIPPLPPVPPLARPAATLPRISLRTLPPWRVPAPQAPLPVQGTPRKTCAHRGAQGLTPIQRRWRSAIARHDCSQTGA